MIQFSDLIYEILPYLAIYFLIIVPLDRGPRSSNLIHLPRALCTFLFPFNRRDRWHDSLFVIFAFDCVFGILSLSIIYIVSVINQTGNYKDLFYTVHDG